MHVSSEYISYVLRVECDTIRSIKMEIRYWFIVNTSLFTWELQNLFREKVSYANDARVMPKMSHKTIWDYSKVVAFFIAIVYRERYIKKNDKYTCASLAVLFFYSLGVILISICRLGMASDRNTNQHKK